MKTSKGNSSKAGSSKLRNSTNTPASSIRTSGIPKYKQSESTSQIPRNKRPPSLEKISRVSLAAAKITPSKFTTPVQNSKYLQVPTSNIKRQSTETIRSSFGGKSRKEGFPISDPLYKTQCIDKILEFLDCNNYDQPYDRTMLRIPTGKDFASIFSFIYRFLDHSYKLPLRYEDDIPRLLKALKYPSQMTKSSFVNVGSPHSWPSVLAMLGWLIDLIEFFNCFDPEYVAFSKDFSDSIDLIEKKFIKIIALFHADDNISEQEGILEEFREEVYQASELSSNDLILLKEEENILQNDVANIPCVKSQVVVLQQQYKQLNEDKCKLLNFIQELEMHISVKDNERVQHNMQLEETEGEARQIMLHMKDLESLKSKQDMNAAELKKFKSHATEVVTIINHHQNEEKELQEQIWTTQMKLSKSQQNLSSAICKYNSLCNRLQLDNCEISSSNFEMSYASWEDDILPRLKLEKKVAKEAAFEAQNIVMTKKAYKEKVEEQVLEVEKIIFKLEQKIKRVDEETVALKSEMDFEELQLQKECDHLNEEASQARRAPKAILHEKQNLLEEAKKELKNFQLLDQAERLKAKQFITQCCQEFNHYNLEKKKIKEQHSIDVLDCQTKNLVEIHNILSINP